MKESRKVTFYEQDNIVKRKSLIVPKRRYNLGYNYSFFRHFRFHKRKAKFYLRKLSRVVSPRENKNQDVSLRATNRILFHYLNRKMTINAKKSLKKVAILFKLLCPIRKPLLIASRYFNSKRKKKRIAKKRRLFVIRRKRSSKKKAKRNVFVRKFIKEKIGNFRIKV